MVYTDDELKSIGFKSVGKNCLISTRASIYGASRISIGDNVRIDDFCVLSSGAAGIKIGNNIHIAIQSSLIGAGEIILEDFCNLSSRVSIYSSSDDYSGEFLTNPMVPKEYTNVSSEKVWLKKHVIIGCGSVVLPGVTIGECSAIGALSLVKSSIEDYVIAAGTPAKKVKNRKADLKRLEQEYLREYKK